MKLLRLHIHGFKSFKDKTTIYFDEGITGIVGPNGCGKSNIVDALFWVMGEQSAKHLRGSNMKDLIFSGSEKYSPATWAEVTLVLENTKGKHIHIGSEVVKPAEIALTRKLYRNGETEYRINNQPARLKDIHEVFMDTGAGAKSYSIIAQGEINRLVQAKPEERRTMIEEVAGITKFKLRKKESLKKIENTQSNLNRLSDLQSEIYKNLKNLEKQAEKAERARDLKAKVKKHELISQSHREFDFLNDFFAAKATLENNAEELEKSQLKKEQIELNLEDERIKKADLIDKINSFQEEYNDLSKELAASEERLKHLKTSAADKQKHCEDKERESESLQTELAERTARLEKLKIELSQLEEQNLAELDLSSMEEKVSLLKEQLSEKEDSLDELKSQLETEKNKFSEMDQQLYRNQSKQEEYANSLQDISAEIEVLEKQYAGYTDQLVKERELLATKKVEYANLDEQLKIETAKLAELKQEQKIKDQEQRELAKELILIESKRDSLIEINKSGEGVKAGALEFIENNETSGFELLGNLIECEPTYTKAIEILLNEHIDSLINFEQNPKLLISGEMSLDCLIPETSGLVVSAETIERMKIKGCGEIIPVWDILKVKNEEFSLILKSFFSGYFIVKDLNVETALKIANDLTYKGLVADNGTLLLSKTLSGSKISLRKQEDLAQGIIQRNNLINELTDEANHKNEILLSTEELLASLNQQLEEKEILVQDLNQSFAKVNNEYIAIKSTVESKESTYETGAGRLDILTNRKSEISKQRLDLLELEEKLIKDKEVLSTALDDLAAEHSELLLAVEDLKATYEDQRSELLTLQASAKTYDSQLNSYRSQIDDINLQLERISDKIDLNQAAIENYNEEIDSIASTVVELAENNLSQVENLSEKEEFLNLIKDELSQLLSSMQEREAEVKDLTALINKIEKINVELELKQNQIVIDEEILVKDIFDHYRIDLRQSVANHLEIFGEKLEALNDISPMYMMETENGPVELEAEEYIFDKRFPGQVKESRDKLRNYKTDLNRLGEINWQAIEDYDRQKLRYDFLKVQEEELKRSLVDLETAIAHIDEKSKARFTEAYNAVNERFMKVFPIIFGGGSASLKIVGNLDSIECGIDIIAQPPGKKMQSINLMSGGEKAMTAVSLIFSIFLVKPSPFCLLDEVDAPLDDANVGRFNELLREMSSESQFILITHNKKTMELNDKLYGVTMQEPGVSKAVSVQLQ